MEIRSGPAGATISVAGDLDVRSAITLAERAETVFGEELPGELIVDVGEVGFCDSSGVAALVRLRHSCDENNWMLRLDNIQPAVRRMLVDFIGLGGYLNVH